MYSRSGIHLLSKMSYILDIINAPGWLRNVSYEKHEDAVSADFQEKRMTTKEINDARGKRVRRKVDFYI